MRNGSGHQCNYKVKMGGSGKKVNENTYNHFPPKNLYLRSFWKFQVVVVQTTAKKCKEKCAARTKLLFC